MKNDRENSAIIRGFAFFAFLLVLYWYLVENIGYFWVMLLPNFLLLLFTCIFLIGYFHIKDKEKKEKKENDEKIFKPISIIVPGYNCEKTLEKCLKSIKEAYYPCEKEIIYVDDGSKDKSVEIAKRLNVKVIKLEKNSGKAKALNTGIKSARHDILALIDSDTYIDKYALVNAVKRFKSDDIGAVTVLIKAENKNNSLLERFQQIEYDIGFGLYALIGRYYNIIFVTPGPMSVFRKSVFEKIGYFDENNITEDLEMGWRLRAFGYRIEYAPDAVAITSVPLTISHLLKQRIRWYRGKLINLKKYWFMLFNPKYGDFGMFMLPFSLTAEFSALTVIMATSVILIKQLWWSFVFLISTLKTHTMISIELLNILSTSAFYIAIIFMVPFVIVALLSKNMAEKKIVINDFIDVTLCVFLYSLFISFAYFSSIFHEIMKLKARW